MSNPKFCEQFQSESKSNVSTGLLHESLGIEHCHTDRWWSGGTAAWISCCPARWPTRPEIPEICSRTKRIGSWRSTELDWPGHSWMSFGFRFAKNRSNIIAEERDDGWRRSFVHSHVEGGEGVLKNRLNQFCSHLSSKKIETDQEDRNHCGFTI